MGVRVRVRVRVQLLLVREGVERSRQHGTRIDLAPVRLLRVREP